MDDKKEKRIYYVLGIFFILLVLIIFSFFIVHYVQVQRSDALKSHAIQVSLNHSDVKNLGSGVESDARIISAGEKEEYPVIYDGVENKTPILVTHTSKAGSLICIVDGDSIKRCFNNINVG